MNKNRKDYFYTPKPFRRPRDSVAPIRTPDNTGNGGFLLGLVVGLVLGIALATFL